MKLIEILIPCVTMFLCGVAFSQDGSVNSTDLNRPFLTEATARQVPEWVAYGLAWPSTEEIATQKISTSLEIQQTVQRILSQCMISSLYDPNSVRKLISLGDWPAPYAVTRIMQFKKKGYIFHTRDSKESLFIGIKRHDDRHIWNMTKDHEKFVFETIETFFLNENVGPRPDKKMHYVPNKGGTEDFYYAYLPTAKKDFWAAYMWTNAKIIVLRVDKVSEQDKKKAAIEK